MKVFADKQEALRELCRRWRVRGMWVFGSAARNELRTDSDLDLLVCFDPDCDWDILDILHLQDELESVFGRSVDLVKREALEESGNWIVRDEALASAEPIYATF